MLILWKWQQNGLFVPSSFVGSLEQKYPHSFKPSSFASSAHCDFCQGSVWGLSKNTGYICEGTFEEVHKYSTCANVLPQHLLHILHSCVFVVDCGYVCHYRCKPKISHFCGLVATSNTINSVSSRRRAMSTSSSIHSSASSISSGAVSNKNIPKYHHRATEKERQPEIAKTMSAIVLYPFSGSSGQNDLTINPNDVVVIVHDNDDQKEDHMDNNHGWVKVSLVHLKIHKDIQQYIYNMLFIFLYLYHHIWFSILYVAIAYYDALYMPQLFWVRL